MLSLIKIAWILLVFWVFHSAQVVFASENNEATEIVEGKKLAVLSLSVSLQRLSDDDIFCICQYFAKVKSNAIRSSNRARRLLNILCILDQLYGVDYFGTEVIVEQLFFIYEKLREFVRLKGRFPKSLETFLGNYHYLLNGLGSSIVAGVNERLCAVLITKMFASLKMNASGEVEPSMLLPGLQPFPSDNDTLAIHISFALEPVFLCALGNRNLAIELLCSKDYYFWTEELIWLFTAGTYGTWPWKASFIFGPRKDLNLDQKFDICRIAERRYDPYICPISAATRCVYHVRFGTVHDLSYMCPRAFAKNTQLRISSKYGEDKDSSHYMFISRVWEREDAIHDLINLGKAVEQFLDRPFALLACDPETFMRKHDMEMFGQPLFLRFIYYYAKFEETISGKIFEKNLFEYALGQWDPNWSAGDACPMDFLVAVTNLATAKNRGRIAEALCKYAVGTIDSFVSGIDQAMAREPNFVYRGLLAELYVEHAANLNPVFLGRIITSAVIRKDLNMMRLLRNRLQFRDELELLPYLDFPSRPVYIDAYCGLFVHEEMAADYALRRNQVHDFLSELYREKFADDWKLSETPSEQELAIVASLCSERLAFDPAAFAQLPV